MHVRGQVIGMPVISIRAFSQMKVIIVMATWKPFSRQSTVCETHITSLRALVCTQCLMAARVHSTSEVVSEAHACSPVLRMHLLEVLLTKTQLALQQLLPR